MTERESLLSARGCECFDHDERLCPVHGIEAINPIGFGCTEDPDFICDGTCSECEVNR